MSDLELQDLLAELDLSAGDELSVLLEELRDLGSGPVPQPSAAVAGLLLVPAAGRPVRSRRTAIISAIVLVSLGTGATAAAADPMLRRGAADVVAAVAQVVRPAPEPRAKPAPPVVTQRRTGSVPAPGAAPSRAVDASVPSVADAAVVAVPSGAGTSTHGSGPHPGAAHPSGVRHDGSGEGQGQGADRHRGGTGGTDEGRRSGADRRGAHEDDGSTDGAGSADDESEDRSNRGDGSDRPDGSDSSNLLDGSNSKDNSDD